MNVSLLWLNILAGIAVVGDIIKGERIATNTSKVFRISNARLDPQYREERAFPASAPAPSS